MDCWAKGYTPGILILYGGSCSKAEAKRQLCRVKPAAVDAPVAVRVVLPEGVADDLVYSGVRDGDAVLGEGVCQHELYVGRRDGAAAFSVVQAEGDCTGNSGKMEVKLSRNGQKRKRTPSSAKQNEGCTPGVRG